MRTPLQRRRARVRAFLDMASVFAWDADAVAYFRRITGTQLTPNMQGYINELCGGIKRDLGISQLSQRFDAIWILANETETAALLNVVKNDHNCTKVNALTFTAKQGYAANGTDSYLRTDFIPSTDGIALTTNAGHLSVYVRTSRTNASAFVSVGARNTSGFTADLTVAPRTGGNSIMRVNDVAATFSAPTNAQGFWIANRTTSGAVQRYRNGAELNTAAISVVQLPAIEAYIGARNTQSAATDFSTDQHAFVSVGGSFSATEADLLTRRLETYMDRLGTGVI